MSVPRHMLSMRQLDATAITTILDAAEVFYDVSRRPLKKVPALRGKTVLNVFYEPSTRTRVSFEVAAKRLSADAINISAQGSSAQKGESLRDTAQTLDAKQADVVVLRHPHSGAAAFVAERIAAQVINAGDGAHEHPTQALLDLLTLRRHFGRIAGLNVAIIGDLMHSRVARSNMLGLRTMGAYVRVAGPRTLLPQHGLDAYGVQLCRRVDEAIEGADVVMALRLQQERMQAGLLPSLREYALEYGISLRRFARAHPQAILMHPGPVNRGVELPPELVDGPRSAILAQVEHGVAVRAALLYLLAAGEPVANLPTPGAARQGGLR